MVNIIQISSKCRLELVDVQEGDYLLYGDKWNKACQIYFYITSLHLIAAAGSFETFQNTNQKDVLEHTCMTNMHVPTWTTAKGNMVMFLPSKNGAFPKKTQRKTRRRKNKTNNQAPIKNKNRLKMERNNKQHKRHNSSYKTYQIT